jgi:hypothetical protein
MYLELIEKNLHANSRGRGVQVHPLPLATPMIMLVIWLQ